MEFIREVNGSRLLLVADEEYQKEAEDLLTLVEEYFETSWDEVDTLIPIHYGQVKVIPKGEDYQVVVQNYEHKLLEEWVEDFSYFLEIVRKTYQAGKRTKTLGRLIPYRFDGPLVVANHTFEVHTVLMMKHGISHRWIRRLKRNLLKETKRMKSFRIILNYMKSCTCQQTILFYLRGMKSFQS